MKVGIAKLKELPLASGLKPRPFDLDDFVFVVMPDNPQL
jgi:hypothetical protein